MNDDVQLVANDASPPPSLRVGRLAPGSFNVDVLEKNMRQFIINSGILVLLCAGCGYCFGRVINWWNFENPALTRTFPDIPFVFGCTLLMVIVLINAANVTAMWTVKQVLEQSVVETRQLERDIAKRVYRQGVQDGIKAASIDAKGDDGDNGNASSDGGKEKEGEADSIKLPLEKNASFKDVRRRVKKRGKKQASSLQTKDGGNNNEEEQTE